MPGPAANEQDRSRAWWDRIAAEATGPQVVNDSKTPSGRVHVGALRGVLIHDAVYRALEAQGNHAKYLFGSDDYDPLDELPAEHAEYFAPHLGKPLCEVPPPPGSSASDLAEHYVGEFFAVFDELGVEAERYRMRDVYRSGRFDEAIDTILGRADVVRDIDRKVAGTQRPDDWYPLQVVCESCGRVGTTRVTHYDGHSVRYTCEPALVTWATGCSFRGETSPFLGNAKLSWKLEWVAKWHCFGISIEGAGKDHNTVGGSRDVAAACLKALFHEDAPLNIPYEFFLVGGAKMSSSRGVGVSARDMADFLPPEVLRFLMIRSVPNRTVDFTPTEQKVVRLFDDFDAVRSDADEQLSRNNPVETNTIDLYSLAEVHDRRRYFVPPFHLVSALVQLPHRDLFTEAARLKGSELTALDRKRLERRAAAAGYWLDRFADRADRLELQAELAPEALKTLRPRQIGFLNLLADDLAQTPWEPDAIQGAIFDRARLTPLPAPEAFQALYRVLFGRESGPRAGNVIAFLQRPWVMERLSAMTVPVESYWNDTGVDKDALNQWFDRHRQDVSSVLARLRFAAGLAGTSGREKLDGRGVIDFHVSLHNGRRHLVRLAFWEVEALGVDIERELGHFLENARSFVDAIAGAFGWEIPVVGPEVVREPV